MPNEIRNYQAKLRARAATIEEDLLTIIRSYEDEILDANREQMMQGLDAQGDSLGEYESEQYAIMKEAYNPLGVVDLRLTGSFHNLMRLYADSFPVYIWSEDGKTEEIVAKYGDIFGLIEESGSWLNRTPRLKAAITEYLKNIYL
jgi:hypothetical protein